MPKIIVNGMHMGYVAPSRAQDVSYDNTTSGLSATNVKNALDELKSDIDTINGKIPSSGILPIIDVGKYSERGRGEANWCKIAILDTSGGIYINRPICFELSGRGIPLTHVLVQFTNSPNLDPDLSIFTTDYSERFYIKKTDTCTWELYGQYTESYGTLNLHRVTGEGLGYVNVEIKMENMTSAPTDPTKVTYIVNTDTAIDYYDRSRITKFGYSAPNLADADVKYVAAWQYDSTNKVSYLRCLPKSDLSVKYAATAGSATDSTKVAKAGDSMTGMLSFKENECQICFRNTSSWYTTASYQTAGDEALVFATKQEKQSFMFVNGEDSVANHNDNRWQSLTPALQIKNGKVAIGKLIASGTTPTYALDVNGIIYGNTGLVVTGRPYNAGDDEGIVVQALSNGYAAVCLGAHNSRRSVFYLNSSKAFWRYTPSGTNYDIDHPGKSGTIALTSDIVNNAVTQTNTTGSASYRILYSATADDTTRTEGARKGRLYFDPNYVRLFMNNSYGFYGNVNSACTFQNGSDSNHAIVHGAYGGDTNQWGWWPNKDGWESLGVSARRWGQIYSTNSAISTSDRNEKKDIVSLDEKAKDLIMNINPVSYKLKDGTSGRTHYGMIAQDVEETLDKLGMTAMDFAGFCKDQKTEVISIEGENGLINQSLKLIEGEYRYALRYDEFIAPMIKTIQLQEEKINQLEEKIELLMSKIN